MPSNDYDVNLVAGPGSIEDTGEAPQPMLYGASEYEYVDILNPLSVTFVGLFGVSRPVNVPMTIGRPTVGVQTETDVRQLYGLELKNPDHAGKANITNKVPIKSGQTVRLLGNEAQVVVRQLVNEIMSREGNKLLLADPFARRQIEQRIVMSRGSVADALGRSPISIQEQLQAVKEEEREIQFPEVSIPREFSSPLVPDSSGQRDDGKPAKRSPGRPAKA